MVRVASAVVLACVGLASCSTNGTANVTLTGPVTLGSEDGFLQKELLTLFGDEQQQAYEVRSTPPKKTRATDVAERKSRSVWSRVTTGLHRGAQSGLLLRRPDDQRVALPTKLRA